MRMACSVSVFALALALASAPAAAASLTIGGTSGPLISSSGPATNPDVSVNLGSTGSTGGAEPTALATTNALDSGRTDGTNATVDVGALGGTTAGGQDATAVLDLGGSGGSSGTVGLGLGGTDTSIELGSTGLGGVGLGGSGVGGSGLGGAGGAGGPGGNGGNGAGTSVALVNGGGGTTLGAARAGSADCGPSASQIARFLAQHGQSASGWHRASNIQVVDVKVCPAGRGRLAAALDRNARVQAIQMAAAADPLISASLARSHHRPGNVLAVDQSGETLTVYAY